MPTEARAYDVILIGAGSVGLPSALSLAERGLRVLVLEELAAPGQGQHKTAIGGVRVPGATASSGRRPVRGSLPSGMVVLGAGGPPTPEFSSLWRAATRLCLAGPGRPHRNSTGNLPAGGRSLGADYPGRSAQRDLYRFPGRNTKGR